MTGPKRFAFFTQICSVSGPQHLRQSALSIHVWLSIYRSCGYNRKV